MQATNKWKKNACGNHEEESKKKERHIVTWTQLVINHFLSFFLSFLFIGIAVSD
jgi:hypothetical protein